MNANYTKGLLVLTGEPMIWVYLLAMEVEWC